MFGHQVTLNFNKAGESHKTLLGGLGSLIVQIMMCGYIYIRFKMFVLREADQNFTEKSFIDLDTNADYLDPTQTACSGMDMTIF